MKNLITQKQLLDDGYEIFKFAGEYLFVGQAIIYIDRGDDDIIKFHDGKHFIRFICSQRDLTFFYKVDKDNGDTFDMLRISDYNEFSIKIVSERFSFKEDEIINLLTQIRDNAIECCNRTNDNLDAIEDKLGDIYTKMEECCSGGSGEEPAPDPEPEPQPDVLLSLIDRGTGLKNVVVNDNSTDLTPIWKEFEDYKGSTQYEAFSFNLYEKVNDGNYYKKISKDFSVVVESGYFFINLSVGYFKANPNNKVYYKFDLLDSNGEVVETSNELVYSYQSTPDPEPEPDFTWKFDDIVQPDSEQLNCNLYGKQGKTVKLKIDVMRVGDTVTAINIGDFHKTIKDADEVYYHEFVMPSDTVSVSMTTSSFSGTAENDVKLLIHEYQDGTLDTAKAIVGVSSIAQDDGM